jgi:hypothetical protein
MSAGGDRPHPIGDAAMIAFTARFIGLWMVAGALVALVVDGTKTIAASSVTMTPLGLAWANLSMSSMMATQEFVQRQIEAYVGHWLWDPVIQWILMAPTWVVFGVVGAWLIYIGRRRRLKSAYA